MIKEVQDHEDAGPASLDGRGEATSISPLATAMPAGKAR
jgi:hypothetical protein